MTLTGATASIVYFWFLDTLKFFLTDQDKMKVEPAHLKLILASDHDVWDRYVQNHANGTIYHLSAVARIIHTIYGHDVYFLGAALNGGAGRSLLRAAGPPGQDVAMRPPPDSNDSVKTSDYQQVDTLVGVLPLVHIHHAFFGNALVSMPYFDMGGILADAEEIGEFLMREAAHIAVRLGARGIELRHKSFNQGACGAAVRIDPEMQMCTYTHKIRILLTLPECAGSLMTSFKSKLRSQVNKPLRDGLKAKIGGEELIDDFFSVFAVNMRDLGSPVHSKDFISGFFKEFVEQARLVVVYKDGRPLSGSLIVGNKDTLANPWASSLREYKGLNPNMLLYWTMLEYACDNGFKYFDFGRSNLGEGCYKFKVQWGGEPVPLNWVTISVAGKKTKESIFGNPMFQMASRVWKKLPVPVTKVIGPRIRKYISL